MGKDIVTSFRIDEDLWKEAKIYAIEEGMTLKELIEGLLKRELENKRKRDKEEGKIGAENKE